MILKLLKRSLILIALILLAAILINTYILKNPITTQPKNSSIGSLVQPTPTPRAVEASSAKIFLPFTVKDYPDRSTSYYVDSNSGNDNRSCEQAQDPATPRRSVLAIMECNPGPGEAVRFRGTFNEPLLPRISGTVLYGVQDIVEVSGSTVIFNQNITNVHSPTDYVTIYGSRRGNSGAFQVLSVKNNAVTVDTQYLPGGQFRPEVAADPGELQAAILRPVLFTAWDFNNLPVWDTD
jgi:hypothetical protein